MALPHNRLGLDYRHPPQARWEGLRVDIHTHVQKPEWTRPLVEAADLYGIGPIWTMCPLEEVPAIQEAFPGRFRFIAIPNWQAGSASREFIADWIGRLEAFRAHGAKLMKFHMAPGTCRKWGLTLDHPLIQQVAREAYDMGYHFMSHVGDPRAWFDPGARYGDAELYGSFARQFEMLDRFLAQYPDRIHLGAHMGGSLEDLEALAARLERFPHYCLDTSATKWILRAVAANPLGVRAFIERFSDRILFGSDLVVGPQYGFDHHASRYWAHRQQWELAWQGESPIEDPDAPLSVPQLRGLELPLGVLGKLYRDNAQRWLGEEGKIFSGVRE